MDEDGKVRVLIALHPTPQFEFQDLSDLVGKTFELMGPKIQSDPHQLGVHCFAPHGGIVLDINTFDIEAIKASRLLRLERVAQALERAGDA